MFLFKKILKENIIAIICLSICICIFILSLLFFIKTTKNLNKTMIEIENMNYETDSSMQLLTLFKEAYPKYTALKNQKVIGKDLRIYWLEEIQTIAQNMNIPSLDIEFSNIRENSTEKDLYASPSIKYKVSENSMKFRLLHEGDLYTFFTSLRNKNNGLFDVTSCNLSVIDGTNFNALENISSECTLKWYSFEDTTPDWKDDIPSTLKADS